MKLKHLALTFLKIGAIGFGGGSALIPVIEHELVDSKNAMDENTFLKHTVISNITPGALPVKLGATCGYELKGISGSMVSSYAVMLPGVIFTVLLLALYGLLGENTIRLFNYASIGISSFIIFLLFTYILKVIKVGNIRLNIMLCLISFLLTGGNELIHLLSYVIGKENVLYKTPVFDISTLDLMIIGLFIIFTLKQEITLKSLIIPVLLSTLYSIAKGKLFLQLGYSYLGNYILILMIFYMIITYIKSKTNNQKHFRIENSRRFISVAFTYLLPPIVLLIVVLIVTNFKNIGTTLSFISKMAISTVTSFGGGEAYVSVADGFFVQGGYIESSSFYSLIVPIANALPGPILVKIIAGVGFTYGNDVYNSTGFGLIFSLLAVLIALGLCSLISIYILILYDKIKDSVFIKHLNLYILPLICGMLISTSIAMMNESIKIMSETSIPNNILSVFIILFVVSIMFLLHKRFKIKDIILLIIAAVISCVTFSFI